MVTRGLCKVCGCFLIHQGDVVTCRECVQRAVDSLLTELRAGRPCVMAWADPEDDVVPPTPDAGAKAEVR